MKFLFLFFISIFVLLNGNDNLNKFDPTKKVITVATLIDLNSAKSVANKLNDFDTYIYKTKQNKMSYYIVYAINIENNVLQLDLDNIRKYYASAYVSSNKRARYLATNNFNKVLFQKRKNSKEINIPIKKDSWVNEKKYAIILHEPIDYSEVKFLSNKYSYNDIFIYSNGYSFLVCIVNISKDNIKELLNSVIKDLPTAKLAPKSIIKYFAKQKGSTNSIFIPKRNKQQKRKIKKKKDNKIFIIAKKEYKNKNYEKAIKLLKKFTNINNSNIEANFLLARSYYITRRFELAYTTYQKILIINEDLPRVRLELAQTYLALNMKKDALREFNRVLKADVPKNVKKNIERRIKFIESLKSNNTFNYMVSINYIEDNNMNNAPAKDVFKIFPFLEKFEVITRPVAEELFKPYLSKEKSKSKQYILAINHKYKINDNFILNNSLSKVIQKYDKNKDRDIEILSFNSTINQSFNNNKLSFNIMASQIETVSINADTNISKIKPYMENIGIGISYMQMLSKTSTSNFSLKITDKIFDSNESSDKESRNTTISYAQQIKTNGIGNFSLNLYLSKDKKKRGSRTDIDKTAYGLNLSNSFDIKKLSTQLSLSIDKIIYSDLDLNYNSTRNDTVRTYAIGFSSEIFKKMICTINITKIDANSNQGAFIYNKETKMLSIAYSF